jgi:hypothetical protein
MNKWNIALKIYPSKAKKSQLLVELDNSSLKNDQSQLSTEIVRESYTTNTSNTTTSTCTMES